MDSRPPNCRACRRRSADLSDQALMADHMKAMQGGMEMMKGMGGMGGMGGMDGMDM